MTNHVESVRRVSSYLRDVANKNRDRQDVADRVLGHADALDAAAKRLLDLEGLTSALPPELGNIGDLPQELRDELSVAKTDELEDQIVTVINAYGGLASLDQILVGLYRKFEVVQKRRFVQNKLYRMEMVWGVEGRKGVYTTSEETARNERDIARHEEEMLRTTSGPDREEDSQIPF